MDIQKLETFIQLAHYLNYSQVAEQTYTTQGNISKHILALEKELGIHLFNRSKRQIALTEAGNDLLPHAQAIVQQAAVMQEKAAAISQKNQQFLTIYTIPTLINYPALEKIAAFRRENPNVLLQLKETENQALSSIDFLDEHSLFFTRLFQLPEHSFDYKIVDEDRFVAVLPKSHPLAGEKQLALEMLNQEVFLLLGQETGLLSPIHQLCQQAGFVPKNNYGGSRIDLILNMVASGLGISLLMEKTIQDKLPENVTYVPITPNKVSQLCFVRKKGTHSSINDAFWQSITC
ncbi:LysR family transcriptional regulator [Enterococcus sp. 669A]|uniref:LysR family transcriptional regulator n=1 Tax=Candidatus Enterococcus moelleringii TaxID=2815325 RepID=A0ABS3L8W6_9ENTE|nr:LysR family transcriptional regulator [Enterococcus sp. 669A]MBO1305191.1 LysR family transcriptional regulator [Enterococcus sp. 669A]